MKPLSQTDPLLWFWDMFTHMSTTRNLQHASSNSAFKCTYNVQYKNLLNASKHSWPSITIQQPKWRLLYCRYLRKCARFNPMGALCCMVQLAAYWFVELHAVRITGVGRGGGDTVVSSTKDALSYHHSNWRWENWFNNVSACKLLWHLKTPC